MIANLSRIPSIITFPLSTIVTSYLFSTVWHLRPYKQYTFWKLIIWWCHWPTQRQIQRHRHRHRHIPCASKNQCMLYFRKGRDWNISQSALKTQCIFSESRGFKDIKYGLWTKNFHKETDKDKECTFSTQPMLHFLKAEGSSIWNIPFPPKKFTNIPPKIFHRWVSFHLVQMTNSHSFNLSCYVYLIFTHNFEGTHRNWHHL